MKTRQKNDNAHHISGIQDKLPMDREQNSAEFKLSKEERRNNLIEKVGKFQTVSESIEQLVGLFTEKSLSYKDAEPILAELVKEQRGLVRDITSLTDNQTTLKKQKDLNDKLAQALARFRLKNPGSEKHALIEEILQILEEDLNCLENIIRDIWQNTST